MNGPRRSLRGRLTLYLVVASGALLLVGGLLLHRAIALRLVSEFDHGLIMKARSFGLMTEEEQGKIWIEVTDEAIPEFGRPHDPEYFEVWMEDGRILRRSLSLRGRDLARRQKSESEVQIWDAPLPDGRRGRFVQVSFHPFIEEEGEEDRALSIPRVRIDPNGPAATLVLARSRVDLDRFLAQLRLILILSGFGLLAGQVGLIRLSLRLGFAPLERLNRRLERLNARSLDERIDPAGVPSELIAFIERLNDLFGRLEESFAREKAFSDHLAHELRTPLAELRAATEVGLRWLDDRASTTASLNDAREIGLHLERITVNLLTLARSEVGQDLDAHEEIALRPAIAEAWRSLSPVAEERGIELRNEVSGGAVLLTDPAKFSLILSNLLDNAVTYSAAGRWVACFSSGEDKDFDLRIRNPAPNLTPADLHHLFDRFWQKDGARSGPHVGLGLPLVASLGRMLGLAVTAHLDQGNLEIRLAKV